MISTDGQQCGTPMDDMTDEWCDNDIISKWLYVHGYILLQIVVIYIGINI